MVDYNELRKKFKPKKVVADGKDPMHRKSSRATVKAIAREYEMKKAALQGSGAPVIRRERPDWCAIQEVDILAARSAKIDQVHELARRTGMFPVFGQAIKHAGGQAAGAYGVMTLSRERPIRYSVVPLADKTEDRVLLVTEFDRYIAVATHFSLHPECALAAAKKANELFAGSEKPVFFAGDLNSPPDSPVIAELKKGFVALSDTTRPTWPTDAPTGAKARTIDWIFVDRAHAAGFAGARAAVLPDALPSDHFPITVTFQGRGN